MSTDPDDKQQATTSEQEIVQGIVENPQAHLDAGAERAIENANISAIEKSDAVVPPSSSPQKTLDPLLNGARIPVKASQIDRELMQVWKASTAPQKEEDRSSVSLLRAMNLIVYVDSDERAEKVDQVISQITVRHPCRTILIIQSQGKDEQKEDLDAWISAHCTKSQAGDRYICSEQITIAAEGAAVDRVPNLALNLLVTDLPVFLWWDTGAPFEGYVSQHLMASLDRVIVDSALWKDPIKSLETMAAQSNNTRDSNRYVASDFNWDRVALWRDSTALFFDPADQRPFLDRLTVAQVEYADGGATEVGNPLQALLYVGWLASRLGWTLDRAQTEANRSRDGAVLFTFRQGQRNIQVALRAVPAPEQQKHGITRIRLAAGADRATYDITLRGDACTTTVIDTKTGEPIRSTRPYLAPNEAQLLDQELELFGREDIYDEAVGMVAQMVAANPAVRERMSQEASEERQNRRVAFDPRF